MNIVETTSLEKVELELVPQREEAFFISNFACLFLGLCLDNSDDSCLSKSIADCGLRDCSASSCGAGGSGASAGFL